MEAMQKGDEVILALTKKEAIILLEWLSRFNEKELDLFQDQAEKKVSWNMEASLEQVISETFDSNYTKILSEAWEKIKDGIE